MIRINSEKMEIFCVKLHIKSLWWIALLIRLRKEVVSKLQYRLVSISAVLPHINKPYDTMQVPTYVVCKINKSSYLTSV